MKSFQLKLIRNALFLFLFSLFWLNPFPAKSLYAANQTSFSVYSYTVAENAGTVTVTVNRNGGSNGAVTVQYATSDGTARAGEDYTATNGTLSWADGDSTPQTFNIPIIDDTIFEPTETVNVTLSNPTGGATLGAQKTAVINIIDNDAPSGQFEFSNVSYTVAENAGTATVTVNRNGGSNGAVTVQYATSNGTALAGTDYTAASGTLSWADGDSTPQTFNVPIIDDTIFEPTETVKLTLSSPTGGATLGPQKTALLRITNDDLPNGEIEFSTLIYTVAENGGSVTASVYRNGGSNGAVTVQYATSNGTALAGADYTAASGTLSWADGDSTPQTFNVPIIDDTIFEPTETVKLTLRSPTGGATLGTQKTAVINILDNDAPNGQFEFSAATYTVAENGGSVTASVYRNGGSSGAVTVQYATSNGTALAGTDYTAASGTLSFADTETTKTFNVPILDDTIFEPTETVKLTLNNPTGGATLGTQKTAVINILDNDAPNGQFEFSAASYTVVENVGTATVTVNRNGGSYGAVTVKYATSNGTALAGADYAAASGTLSFADTETTQTFNVSIIDDTILEPTETIKLALSSPTGGASLGAQKTAVVNITDDDGAKGQFEFSDPTYTVVEDAGLAAITVKRNGGSSGAVTVNYATSNGTALAGADYTAAGGTLSFADTVDTQTFNVSIIDDTILEPTETVKLTLSSPTGGAALGAQKTAVLNITDDDVPNGQFEFSAATYTVVENVGTATVTVNRNGGSYGAVTVKYATSDGTAKAGADYAAASGTLSFADGVTSQTFTVPIANDTIFEPTKTVKLTLSSPTGGAVLGTQKTALLNITDDDASNGQFEFSAASYTVVENVGTATVTVNRNGGSSGAATVNYAASNGTAKAGADYTAVSGTLSFADTETTKTFNVTIFDDSLNDPTKTVKLTLSSPTGGAALGTQKTAVLNITDNDGSKGQFEFSSATYTVAEGAGLATITVKRNGGSSGAAMVKYATSNGTAKTGADYTAASGILSFADTEDTKTFTVAIVNDTIFEPTKTVKLTLSSPTGGAALGAQKTAILNITDDDAPNGQFEFSAASYTVVENVGTATVTVNRNGGNCGAATVKYATSNGTAKTGSDYTAASGILNFADGVTSQTFSVSIINDNVYEPTETVKLTLSSPTGGASLGAQKTAVLRITNDDAPNGQIEY